MSDQSMQVLDAPLPPAAVALNRFGLGARPDDVPTKDPKGWLRDQLEAYQARPPMIAALPNSEAIAIPCFQSRRQANAASDAEARKVARSIGNNQLIKCSWYGADAYWGRLLAEAGSCGVEFDPERSSVSFGGIRVADAGIARPGIEPGGTGRDPGASCP